MGSSRFVKITGIFSLAMGLLTVLHFLLFLIMGLMAERLSLPLWFQVLWALLSFMALVLAIRARQFYRQDSHLAGSAFIFLVLASLAAFLNVPLYAFYELVGSGNTSLLMTLNSLQEGLMAHLPNGVNFYLTLIILLVSFAIAIFFSTPFYLFWVLVLDLTGAVFFSVGGIFFLRALKRPAEAAALQSEPGSHG